MTKLDKIFKYPILSNLILFQILAVVIGLGILFVSYSLTTNAQMDSAISKLKENIKPHLELKQEEWRTWNYMSLDDALDQSLAKYKAKYGLAGLQIIPRQELPKKLTPYDIVIPEKSDFMDTVVYARLSTDGLQGITKTNRLILLLISCLGLGFIGVVFASGKYIKNKMYLPILKLNHAFLKLKSGDELEIDYIKATGEVQNFLKHIKHMYHSTRESERMAVVGEVASQVAHDIRSPLAALRMSVSNMPELSEDKRLLVRRAVQRIDDIANDLGEKNKQVQKLNSPEKENSAKKENRTVQLLSSLIETLVSEKRVQYRLRSQIEISVNLGKSSYGIFAKIQPSEFKRILSNLINNSVEAISGSGSVELFLEATDQLITIKVKDDGKGIAQENIFKVTERGVSVNKANGSGLGLYYAKKTINSWGGLLKIDSEIGKGTVISIIMPRHDAPEWFVSQIQFESDSQVIVLDDDQSIHQVWNNRLESMGIGKDQIKHFTSSEAFTSWYQSQNIQQREDSTVYLVDYELLGSKKTGLALIRDLHLSDQALLVTSRFEEEDVRQSCLTLGLKLLPKSLAEFVPLVVEKKDFQADLILIDDDEIVLTYWNIEARSQGKKIKSFKRPKDFLRIKHKFSKDVPIYIDVNLADGVRGEDVSQVLNESGFQNLYLATGQDPAEFSHMPWLKGIVGKDPPWL